MDIVVSSVKAYIGALNKMLGYVSSPSTEVEAEKAALSAWQSKWKTGKLWTWESSFGLLSSEQASYVPKTNGTRLNPLLTFRVLGSDLFAFLKNTKGGLVWESLLRRDHLYSGLISKIIDSYFRVRGSWGCSVSSFLFPMEVGNIYHISKKK